MQAFRAKEERMSDNRARQEPGDKFKNPAESVHGHLPYFRFNRPRTKIQEGGMKRNRKPCIGKPIRDLPEIGLIKAIEITMIETDLRIDPLPDDHRQEVRTEAIKRYMNLDFFQYLTHADLTDVRWCAPFTTGGPFSQRTLRERIVIDRNPVLCY